MWLQISVLAPTLLVISGVVVGHRRWFSDAAWSWRVLSASGLCLAVFGLDWVLRAWDPTAGPYRIGEVYPFGTHLEAWQATFGFTWLALGLLFFGATLRGASRPASVTWFTLLAVWLVAMVPHGVIGAAMILRGQETAAALDIGTRGRSAGNVVLLLVTGLVAFVFFASSLVGFAWTGWEQRRRPK